MRRRFSFGHRLVRCPRCRRQMAADVSVCPHCEFDRMRNPERASRRHHAARTPLRAVVVIVLALLAIGGYVYLSEPALDAPLFTSR